MPIVPDGDSRVSVRVASRDDGVVCLFTDGMLARPMPPGPGGDDYQYAELAVYLADWPADPVRWLEPEYLWPINWLRRLARYPFETGVGYGGPVAVVANDEPPRPLGPNTAMTCWLFLADKEPLGRLETPDGRSVVFYTLLPIHTAERDFEREHGTAAPAGEVRRTRRIRIPRPEAEKRGVTTNPQSHLKTRVCVCGLFISSTR